MKRWWQFGLFGAFVLLLATAVKAVLVASVGRTHSEINSGEVASFCTTIFGMGFLCGIVVWASRGISRRFGPAGDAAVGLIVIEVFFVSCMLLFDPALLGSKFRQGGLPMLGFAVPLGLFGGWYIGRDFRPRRTASRKSTSVKSNFPKR